MSDAGPSAAKVARGPTAGRSCSGSALAVVRVAFRAVVILAVVLELVYITSVPGVQRVLFGEPQALFYRRNHEFLLSRASQLYEYVMGHYSSYVHCALWGLGGLLGLKILYTLCGRRSPFVRKLAKSVEAVGRFFKWLWVHL